MAEYPTNVPAAAVPRFMDRRSVRLRLRGGLLAGGAVGLAVLAFSLTPIAGGYGTHEQLGLPPCSFLTRTGWPCPTCGLTTSMALMAHGRVAAALRAHPFGVVLAALLVAVTAAGIAELATGRDVLALARPGLWWLVAVGVLLVLSWVWKLTAGWVSGELPIR